ncbi:MAG: hypothetical protein OM95_10300 [Bdellovibrio sp. ArHS]|uniref:hypothetical protein n=1 Tax=Bdellovibrio sp. ArHS TaxID=1569284 RepID=UPI000582CC37|nr:hypothetical protein [Bdellovibrio sp. ArHS]KHD88155.1 MAG: hypothetical protein OM95_10300 [Bdellovibrio sp. ArHS]
MTESLRLSMTALILVLGLLLLAEANTPHSFLWHEASERYRFYQVAEKFQITTQDLLENPQACALFLLRGKKDIIYEGATPKNSAVTLELTTEMLHRIPPPLQVRKLWLEAYQHKKDIRKIDGKLYRQLTTRLNFILGLTTSPWIEAKKISIPVTINTNEEGKILDCAAQTDL